MVVEAIESALAQTRPAGEIVVVDDGSQEPSEAAVRGFGDRVRYIRQGNRGLAGARNTGIRETRADLLVFLDDDDLLEGTHVASLASLLESDPAVSAAYGDALYTDLEGRTLGVHSRMVPELRDADRFPENALSFRCFPPIHSAMFRRTVFERHGGFNDSYPYAEDVEMWLRAAPFERFAYVDRIVCRYRKHAGNMVRDLPEMEAQHRRALKERFARGDLPDGMARLEGTAFANLCLTHMGHFARAGETGESLRCVGRMRRAYGRSLLRFCGILVREYAKRRAARRFR